MSLDNKKWTTFEKTVILTSIIVGIGVGAGFPIIWPDYPPIISSIFISIAVSVIVYHFLGGIKDASFKVGAFKVAGSIAALIGCTLIINNKLEKQLLPKYDKSNSLILDSKLIVRDAENNELGMLYFEEMTLINKSGKFYLNDSIYLSDYSCPEPKLDNPFVEYKLIEYAEIKYWMQLSPFRAWHDEKFYKKNNRKYRNIYHSFPITVTPAYVEKSDRTQIVNTSTNSVIGNFRLENDEIIVVKDFLESDDLIFLIRVRQLDRLAEPGFVQYQILEFSCNKQE